MSDVHSGRPPVDAFYTVTDSEQARLLSDNASLRYFRPFVARELSVKEAADELGVALDTMLYRVKVLLGAGLLRVARLERRAGRPIKYYRSVHDAYIIPFDLTPYANLEEILHLYFRECADIVVPSMARTMRQIGREGRILYRDAHDGTVWQYSADSLKVLQRNDQGIQRTGADFMDDRLELTDAEARELLNELYGVWQRFRDRKGSAETRKSYFFQFIVAAA